MDFRFVRRRMFFQKFGINSQLRMVAFFDLMQRISQRHVAILKMMAVGFAVGGDMHELIVIASFIKRVASDARQMFRR